MFYCKQTTFLGSNDQSAVATSVNFAVEFIYLRCPL